MAFQAKSARGGIPFAVTDFWRLWFVGVVLFVVRWLEMLAMAVFVYQRTGSPFLVAMLTMLRLLPMALFGAVMGALADRIERRTSLLIILGCLGITSSSLALLAHWNVLAVWHLALATFISGTTWAADNPVRRMMIGEVVGPDRVGLGMSIDIGTNNASRMLGPVLGGTLLALVGIAGAFTLSVVLYLFAGATALAIAYRNGPKSGAGTALWARIRDGLAIVRGNPRLVGTLTITIIFNIFGWPFTSMIPVIGQDNLSLGPSGIGVLASMDGLGSFAGALLIALLARPVHYPVIYVGGSMFYLALLPVFALMSHPLVAGSVLLLTGLAAAGFSVMQSTLIYLLAPGDMRSRVFGVLAVCIGTGPIGFVHLGLLADWIGAQAATATIGIEGLLVMAASFRLWRGVWRATG
jgi:MFS family permease